MMMWKKGILGLMAMGLLLPRTGVAQDQEISWSYRVSTGGWIGISVDFTSTFVGEGDEETLVVVTNVVEGSPAEQAGIRAGDTITHLDGRPASQRLFVSLAETLEAGDLVRIIVDREGGSREITVEAGEKPAVSPDFQEIIIKLDTVRTAILKGLDSLRGNIAGIHLNNTEGELSLEVLRIPSGENFTARGTVVRIPEIFVDGFPFETGNYAIAPELAMPFEGFLVKSQASDSLQENLALVRKELNEIRRRELTRQREIAAGIQGPIEEALRRDEVIRELRSQEAELAAQHEALAHQLRQVREQEVQRQWVEAEARTQDAFARTQWTRERTREEQYRELENLMETYQKQQYRSPVIVGRNMVLGGANLQPLTPAISEMLSVDRGVLVLSVMEGSPAAEIGLKDLDVIIQIAGEEVTSIGDLRMSLGLFEGPVRIHLVRKGEPVAITVVR